MQNNFLIYFELSKQYEFIKLINYCKQRGQQLKKIAARLADEYILIDISLINCSPINKINPSKRIYLRL